MELGIIFDCQIECLQNKSAVVFILSSTAFSIILIWFLISFRLLCVTWIHFHSSDVPLQSCFASNQNLRIPLKVHFTTQSFDLMTGLNDVRYFSSSLQKALDVDKSQNILDASSRDQWIFKFTKLTFNLCQYTRVSIYITFWCYIILN